MRSLLITMAIVSAITTSAFAHSPLKSTLPADNSELTDGPKNIQLTFGKPARVTKVVLVNTSDAKKTERRLNVPSKAFENVFNLEPGSIGAGTYQVKWRALSKDGHALKGVFKFSVKQK